MNQSNKATETSTNKQVDAFYITGGNVPADALSYVTRDADARLLQHLLQGDFCYILTSRQMGKSSLMTHMVKRLREHHVAPAVLDLSSQGFSLTAEQWYNGLLEQLGRRLKIEDEIDDFCQDHPHLSPLQLWQQALRHVVLEVLPQPVVIFIDEIDVVRSLTFSTDEFFAAIRACYNARTEDPAFTRLSFCLLGVATPADLIANPRLTPFNIGTRIELSDFSREEANGLSHGLGPNAETNRVLLDRIYYWTGGHPYLTQRLCQAVAENDANLTERSVDICAERLFLSSKAQRQDSNLMFVQQRMLPPHEDERVGLLTLYGKVLSGKGVVGDSETGAYVSELKLAGIVAAAEGQLKVRNRIYAQVFGKAWIEENMPGAEVRRLREAYRRGLVRAGAVASAIVGVMGLLTLWAIHAQMQANHYRANADSAASKARGAATVAQAQSALAEQQRQKAEHASYTVTMNLIPREWDLNNIGHVLELLDETRKSEFRGFEWGYWNRMCHRDLLTLKGHAATVKCVAFSPDGQRIVTGSEDRTARVWDTSTGRELLTLKAAEYSVTSVCFSPDGKRIVTGSDLDSVRIWDASTGHLIRTFKGLEGPIGEAGAVTFSPDGNHILMGNTLWEAATGRKTLTLSDTATTAAFSPDGKRIVTGSTGQAKVWDTSTGRLMLTLKVDKKGISSVAFSPDGKRIAAKIIDSDSTTFEFNDLGRIKVWNSVSGVEEYVGFGPGEAGWDRYDITSACFSDSKRIVTGSKDKTVKIWDAARMQEIFTLKGHVNTVTAVCFSSDGKRIATGSKDHTVKIWDAVSYQETGINNRIGWTFISSMSSSVGGNSWTVQNNQTAKVFKTSKEPIIAADGRELVSQVSSIAFSPDGKRIATGSNPYTVEPYDSVYATGVTISKKNLPLELKDYTTKLWDAAKGLKDLTLQGHAGYASSLAFSPDGKYLVTGGFDNIAGVWDAATGHEVRLLKGHTDHISSVSFSPDGKRIVTGSFDKTARIWDIGTGRELITFKPGDYVSSVCFSPDSKRIITGSYDKTARVWNVANGKEEITLKGHTGAVLSVACSPDGKQIVTGSYDNTARVWDAMTGRELITMQGHVAAVACVTFSPDGKRVISGSKDKTARVWDATTGRELLVLKGHQDGVTSVIFAPDGGRIATGSNDGTVKIWQTLFN